MHPLDPRDRGIVVHFFTQNDVIENSIGAGAAFREEDLLLHHIERI